MDEILAAPDKNALLLPTESLFMQYPALTLSEKQERRIRDGAGFSVAAAPGRYRARASSGDFLALVEVSDGVLKTVKSFFTP